MPYRWGESQAGPPPHRSWKVVRRLERGLRLWRGIVCAPDRLVVVHHGSGHQAGLISRQKSNGARDFMRINETAKWLCRRRLFQPIWAYTMILNLNPVFAFGGHPSDVEPVDADTVAHNRIGRIFCKSCQSTF